MTLEREFLGMDGADAGQAGFVWTDAWVLAAVAVGGGLKGCVLKDVIAAGDLVNRALLSGDELRASLPKLISRGYVTQGGGYYVIAGPARQAVEQLLEQGASSFSVMQFFEDFLQVDPYTAANEAIVAPDHASLADLSDVRVAAATNAYKNEIAALWRELRQVGVDSLPERAIRLLGERK
jgi:hypothetical protein